MHRRTLLLGAAAAPLARPAIGAQTKTLKMIPQVALNSIDPIWTSSQIARNMGFMVFDMLYGRDEAQNPQFQMVEADLMEDNAKTWTLRLRDGLLWHDGEKVLARDCVVSLRRWMKRNAVGGALEERIDSLGARGTLEAYPGETNSLVSVNVVDRNGFGARSGLALPEPLITEGIQSAFVNGAVLSIDGGWTAA